MKLGKNTLRKLILNEMRSTLIKEQVDPQQFASHIVETYGDMFNSEGYIDSQIENHVYWELIDEGHMTEDNFDFDVLNQIMEHLESKGIVQESYPGIPDWKDISRPKRPQQDAGQLEREVAADIARTLKDSGMNPMVLRVLDKTLTKIVAFDSIPAAEKRPVSNLIDRLGVANKKFQRLDYYVSAKTLQRAIRSLLTQRESQVRESKMRSLVSIVFGSKK